MYKIFETEEYIRDIERLAISNIQAKLTQQVYPQLRNNPFYGTNIRRLKNYKPPTWRYRIGKYRFFYEVDQDDRVVMMTAADHRKDCY